jgi:hypothetical protein
MDQKSMSELPVDNLVPEPIKWNVQRRLEFIDFRLLWDGHFNRKDLSDIFGISAQQASSDIAQYEKAAPANLAYDGTRKAYVRSNTFQPRYIGESADRYLLQLLGVVSGFIKKEDTWFGDLPIAEAVMLKRKPINSQHLKAVLDAIRNKHELTIEYHSMSGGPSATRTIMPHAIVSNQNRWHTRAWAKEHNDFRDFNLNRIISVSNSFPSVDRSEFDYEWHRTIDLVLIPNPKLSADRQQAVRAEHTDNITDGKILIPTRLSLSFYLINEYNLEVDADVLRPEKQQLVLCNLKEIEAAKKTARLDSLEALNRTQAPQ